MKLLIQTFTTSGFIPWVETMLESLKATSGQAVDVRVDSVDLSPEEIQRIQGVYRNVTVRNIRTDDADLQKEIGISLEKLQQWKRDIENGHLSEKNFLYKIFISVNQRYRKMDQVIADAQADGYDLLLHCDADVFYRRNILESPLLEELTRHDVAFYVNNSMLVNTRHNRKLFGAFLCFNLKSPGPGEFIQAWMAEIDATPFLKRWRGFGQSVLYYVWNSRRDIRYLDLFSLKDRFRMSRKFGPEADIWFGSNASKLLIRIRRHIRFTSLFSKADMTRSIYQKELSRLRGHDTQP